MCTFLDFSGNEYWVDGSNVGHRYSWQFSDGSVMPLWNGFWKYTPATSERCVRLKETDQYVLNDLHCFADRLGYICEF